MKKKLLYILLLLFVNNSLLLPQVSGTFTYSGTARYDTHMGSLMEWVSEVPLQHQEDLPGDNTEDEDKTLENSIDENFCHRLFQRSELINHPTLCADRSGFPEYAENKFPNLAADITAPPPEHS